MCAEEAEGQGWAAIAAFAYQHRGKVHYDAEDYDGGARRLQARTVPAAGVRRAATTSSSRPCSRSTRRTDAARGIRRQLTVVRPF